MCTDQQDNDGDGRADCADPDCYALEACRPAFTKDPRKPTPPVEKDAGPVENLPPGPADAGREPLPVIVDASAFECSPCLPTETCVDGECQVVAVDQAARFSLRILSAVAPNQDSATRCYDSLPDCPGNISISPFAVCNCPTDPFVRIVLARGSTKIEIGMTDTVAEDTTPTFPSNAFELTLDPGDVLIFEVWDAEPPPMKAEKMFECSPDLSAPRAAPISCSARGGALGAQLLEVKAELLTP